MTNSDQLTGLARHRDEYRAALTAQLRDGIAARRSIDLRDVHEPPNVMVAFADEKVCPAWEDLSDARVESVHLFVAPIDFTTGRLTMVTATDGSCDLDGVRHLLDSQATFGMLSAALRELGSNQVRVGVARAPENVTSDGFSFSFAFADLIDV